MVPATSLDAGSCIGLRLSLDLILHSCVLETGMHTLAMATWHNSSLLSSLICPQLRVRKRFVVAICFWPSLRAAVKGVWSTSSEPSEHGALREHKVIYRLAIEKLARVIQGRMNEVNDLNKLERSSEALVKALKPVRTVLDRKLANSSTFPTHSGKI